VGQTSKVPIFSIPVEDPIVQDLAKLIVSILNLDMPPDSLNPEAPLFGENGLGLDSIDILEIALAISKRYGFELRSDDANNVQIFASLSALGKHIASNRTR
jgi:acyl carrier protein